MNASTVPRVMVLWCPNWPLRAAVEHAGISAQQAIAVLSRGLVLACSASAQEQGIQPGQRLRQAQALVPELLTVNHDPIVNERRFEPIAARAEKLIPGVHVLGPGCLAVNAKGPARYFGSEAAAAHALLDHLRHSLADSAHVGVADGVFTAQRAAQNVNEVTVVQPHASAGFLSALPLDTLGDPELSATLYRLGLSTLGDFAQLDSLHVRQRFGAAGELAQLRAGGADPLILQPRRAATDLVARLECDPPIERADQLAFVAKPTAESFTQRLESAGLVCTEINLHVSYEAYGANADSSRVRSVERLWKHPRYFTADDVIDRLRWQVQENVARAVSDADADAGARSSDVVAGVRLVVISPHRTDSLGNHQRGLWGNGPQEQIHHGLSRIQGLLGHRGVLTPRLTGGRLLKQRQLLVPWGDAEPADALARRTQPWPGALPGPPPSVLTGETSVIDVLDYENRRVNLDERMMLSAEPAVVVIDGRQYDISGWAGPWPIHERWWEPGSTLVHRFQILTDDSQAWLLLYKTEKWYLEAHYD